MTTSDSTLYSTTNSVEYPSMPQPLSETCPSANGRKRVYQQGYCNEYGYPSYDDAPFWQPPPFRIPSYHRAQRPYTFDQRHSAPRSHFYGPPALIPPPKAQLAPVTNTYDRKSATSGSKSMTSGVSQPCRELGPFDVVCGRGAPTDYNPGNLWFKNLSHQFETAYLCAKRSDKPGVAKKLLEAMQSHGGRFVRRERASGGMVWIEIEERRAYEKVCQALREGAPGLRRQVFALSKAKGAQVKADHDRENLPFIQNL
jgi:hypothetical protein